MSDRRLREWAKDVVRSVPNVPIRNTDAVPTFKRRVTACIDRAAVLLALEHAESPPAESREAEALRLLGRCIEWHDAFPDAPQGDYPFGEARSFLQENAGGASTSSAGAADGE